MDETADEEDGVFAAVWRRHGGRGAFRVGLVALCVAVVSGVLWRTLPTPMPVFHDVGTAFGVLAMGLLGYVTSVHGGLKSRATPPIPGAPRAVPVRFAAGGVGFFGKGAGEIRFPERALRLVHWTREPWDLLVAVGLWCSAAWLGWGGLWPAIVVASLGLPRRRETAADVLAEDVVSFDVAGDRLVLVSKNGEPLPRVTMLVPRASRKRLLAVLRERFPDAVHEYEHLVPGSVESLKRLGEHQEALATLARKGGSADVPS